VEHPGSSPFAHGEARSAAAATPGDMPASTRFWKGCGCEHHLETATKDFHGHRVKAIEHLDQAFHETEICEHEP